MIKTLVTSIGSVLLLVAGYFGFHQADFGATSIFVVQQGGTGANTLTGCLTGNGTAPITGSGSPCGSGGSGTYPFTPSTNYGVSVSATSTPIYDSAGLQASSTSYFSNINAQYASTTNLETVLYANEFPGSDIGAKINAAYAALPSTGGKIVVPSGSYSFSTPISFATNQKVVLLSCPSGGGASNNAVGGTTLTFSATTGSAITINTNNYIVAGVGIENCNVQGTNGTTARTTVGISIGGTNGGFNQLLNGVNVNGFGTGVQYNSNTSFDTIENSTIHFNGRNVDEPDTSGANGENMRILNSVIADSNNQAGGATDLFCVAFQESGNVQWQIINTSVDDCQVYLNQFGGTANILTLTSDHFENPNTHTYDYINMLSNTPADEVVVQGGDMMNDVVGGMPEYISSGGDIVLTGVMINSNSPVTTPVTRVVKNLNATNIDSVTWTGLLSNGKGATYVSDYIPFSPIGQATGLGVVFNIGSSTPTRQGNLGVGTTSIIGQFAKFALQLNSINDNYSSAFAIGSSTASATTTLFSISNTGSTTAANGFNITAGCYALNGTCISSAVSNTFGKTWEIIAGLFGANVLSPTTTIPIYVPGTGTSTIENLAGVLDASAFTGSDIGTQVNNAYAAAPAGATITIPVGNYTTATSINFNTNGKGVTLNCAIGTVITYSGTGDLIDYNIGQTGGAGSSLNNCHLYGSGTTTASVAVRIGGTNGARNFTMNNVQIENFGSTTSSGAVTTGDNAYILNFNNDFVHHNGKDFYDGSATNAGENDNFTGGTWADCRPIGTNCVDFPTASTASVRFSDVSIDDAALHIGAIVRSVTINGGHFENPAGDNFPKYTPITIDSSLNTSVTIEGTAFLNGANANRASQFISNGGNLTLIGITGEDYGGGTKGVGALVTNTGNGYTRIYSTSNQDGAWQQFFNSTSGSGAPQYVQAENGFVGLGTSSPQFNFVVATSTPLGASPRIEVDGLSNGTATSSPGIQISLNSVRNWLLFTLGTDISNALRFRDAAGTDVLTLGSDSSITIATTTAGCLNTSSTGIIYAAACASGGTGAYPFTPTTNFGSLAQATTGIPWFQNGLQASSTSQLGQTVFSGPVTGGFFLSTTTLATKPVYAVGNDSTTGIGLGASTGGLNFYGSGNAHFQITSAGPGSTFAFGPSFSSSQGPELIDTNGSDSIPSLYFTGSGYGLWYDGSLEVSGGGNRLATFGGSSITFAQPFTVNAGKLSTLNGGFLSTASSTVNAQFAVSTSTQGCATFGVGGVLYSTGIACGTGGGSSTFGNAFNFVQATPNNYLIPTTTTTGLLVTASSTIGDSTQTGGLTISGGATTTATSTELGGIRLFGNLVQASLNAVPFQAFFNMSGATTGATTTVAISNDRGSTGVGNNDAARLGFYLSGTDGNTNVGCEIGTYRNNNPTSGTSDMDFKCTNGTVMNEILHISGNKQAVGIGTTSPSQALSVQGNALISGNETLGGTLNLPLSNGGLAVNGDAVYSTPTTTLSAGSNITLTPSGNNIQIAASGGSGQSPYSWVVAPTGGDFTTIQGALDRCGVVGGGNIILTASSYAQAGTGLLWKGSNCVIWGRGAGTTTITFTGATTGFKTNTPSGDYTHDELHNILLSGDSNASGVAIDWSDMTHGIVDDVQITGFARGLRLNDTQNITFYNSFTNIDMNAISVIGIDASSTNPVNANTFHNIFIGSTVANVIAFQMNNGNGNLADMIFAEPGSISGTVGLKLFDNKLATNNGVFNNTFSNWYIEANATGVSIPLTVNPAAGGIQRNTLSNITSEANTTDWSVVAGAIALNNFNCNYDSNFGNCLTSEAGPFGIGTSSEMLGIGNTPNAMLAVNASSTKALNAFLVGLGTGANTTLFRIANTGTVFAPNTTTQSAAATDYWCYDANGQFIRVANTCTVSAAKFKKDVTPLTQGLSTVLSMQPVNYYLNDLGLMNGADTNPDDTRQQIGFVADDASDTVPLLVLHSEDGEIHGFNYEQYTAVLTLAIQQLNSKVDAIKQGSRSVEENWQDILIGLLIVGFIFQQYQIRKLKK